MIEILPLTDIGEVLPGSDLAAVLIAALNEARIEPTAGDVLVVTQKIVSKAENRFADLSAVVPGERAVALAKQTGKDPRLVELVLSESSEVLRSVPNVLITRQRAGHVMANAGIDRSNIGSATGEQALLLPEDSDASAERLWVSLGKRCAVVISDSFGRPWRHGVVNVAIGVAGMPSLIDRRGDLDRDGRRLEVTQIALGDMIATAAGLAMGEGAEGVPAALIRGVRWSGPNSPASALVRPLEEDLFR
ncbi:coenzyme F420-0:L-glutamate ligase [Sphingomonas sp. CGMCC 1.13654]|uniref:Coenzyme F420-0:L-glutamate ligase n=1 Tax=Sphingomonas chungangi TaxID=2683589 RepID=A0A838L4T5_9SPHN|nr:coenzyme F420-0:L-glutamate ligase [Sphingomonas chungangi]MBA2933592.1 coenzyme F420-0:L-glutamate ligase [Sphingomonas chungangi]MVW54925.1 coenzyme F420-0:L-glutamate ligase [Sphingomonas chungangi]